MEKLNALKTIEFCDDYAIFSINPKIYPIDIVYSASYIMIDKAFILLDGDPFREIKVEIRKKGKEQDIKQVIEEFNQELLNYAVYRSQTEKNKALTDAVMEKILLTNTPDTFVEIYKELKKQKNAERNKF